MSQESVVNLDIPCVYCGYNLRTLAADGLCPECGRKVSQTLWLAARFQSRRHLLRLRSDVRWLGWIPSLLLIAVVVLSLVPVRGYRSLDLLLLPLFGLGIAYIAVFISFVNGTDNLSRSAHRTPLAKSLGVGAIAFGALFVLEMMHVHTGAVIAVVIGGLIYTHFALLCRRTISIFQTIGISEPAKTCLLLIWSLNLLVMSALILLFGDLLFQVIPHRSPVTDDHVFFVLYVVARPVLLLLSIAGFFALIIRVSAVLRRTVRSVAL